MSNLRRNSVRVSGELAIVVFGVLIALWADGLAEMRSELRSLDGHLRSIQDELRDEIATLDSLAANLELEATALRTLAIAGATGELPPDSTLIDLVYAGLLDVTIFEPGLSAVTDFESSGLVPHVDDLELRLALSALRQSIGIASAHADVNRVGPQQSLFDPFVLEELPFVWRSLPAIQEAAPWRGRELAWEPLFDDRGQALVTMRYDFVLATSEDWQGLRDEMERLIGLIDRALD